MPPKMTLDIEMKKSLDEYRVSVAAEAEEIVFKKLPRKMLELQKLIDSTLEPSSPFHISHAPHSTDTNVYPSPNSVQPPATPVSSDSATVPSKSRKRKVDTEDSPSLETESKKRKLDSGEVVNGSSLTTPDESRHVKNPAMMVSNKHNVAIHEHLKRECEILAELCDKIKLWINLAMPKIEDGDNFGVQIQEEVLSELQRMQDSAYNLRDAARQDYLTRAKICSKIMKYPNLEDYALALREHDEKQLYVARQNLYDLRCIYAILTDILHKNIEKIRSPKGNNATSMY